MNKIDTAKGHEFWPASLEERNLAGDIHITVQDFDSYAWPPGDRRRYTEVGWQKAIQLGVCDGAAVQTLRSEAAALRNDAMRYRWLRKKGSVEWRDCFGVSQVAIAKIPEECGEILDVVIDAEMDPP